MSKRIGILHPGQMGASVGAAARAAGASVAWASAGRSDATRLRAKEAGLEDVDSLEALAESCDVLLSICPPAAATELAVSVAAVAFDGIFVDANAVAPHTACDVAAIVREGGARFVDGGIIGPPAHREGTTRLYLSGGDAEYVARVFEGGVLEAVTVDARPGAASALKMCYAAWTKGSAALLIAIRSLAAAEGVEAPLMDEWQISQPGLDGRSDNAVRRNAFKAWRFAGEMHEIAASFEAAALPGGFHRAAAKIYERLAGYRNCDPAPEVGEAIAAVLSERTP